MLGNLTCTLLHLLLTHNSLKKLLQYKLLLQEKTAILSIYPREHKKMGFLRTPYCAQYGINFSKPGPARRKQKVLDINLKLGIMKKNRLEWKGRLW